MDQITKEANPDPEALNELLFADDLACKAEIQNHTDQLNRSCINHSMRISMSKTKVMTVGRSPGKLDISIDGTQLKQTAEFNT